MNRTNGTGSDEPVAYDFPRGTCPRCGGGQVQHLIIGMPTAEDAVLVTPKWVTWAGCVHPGHDRECKHCGHTWSVYD